MKYIYVNEHENIKYTIFRKNPDGENVIIYFMNFKQDKTHKLFL